MNTDVEIIRWSGIWRQGDEVRVGVRLADGRDALLVAFTREEDGGNDVHYALIIQGKDHPYDFIIPTDLESKMKDKLFRDIRNPGSRSLKDLKLF